MGELNNYNFEFEPPTLYETLQAAHDAGLVGEDDTVLTAILAMIRGHLLVMTGLSRAGKDEVVDAAEFTFPTDEMVYEWPVDDSETAAYYNRDEINQYPVHRFPDLARLEDHQEKILKAFGEGRDARRNRTDIAAEQRGDDPIRDQVIECPHTIIAFIASDNENVDLDDYPELRNRALTVSVDASEQQTHSVNAKKAEERAGRRDLNVLPTRRAEIQQYHASIPVDEWVTEPQREILNPAAIEIHNQKPIPEKFPEARQDFDRLLEFMETVALYHYTDRLVRDNVMLVTPVDVWLAMTILGNKMVMSALNLTKEDRAILDLLENSTSNLTKADIQQALRAQGYHIGDRDVARSLDSMRMKGYVNVHQGSPNSFSVSPFASVTHHDAGIEYEEIVAAARDEVYEIVPEEAADLYVERFTTGDALRTTHPLTGETVDIRERDDLEELVSSGLDEVEEVLGETTNGGNDGGDSNEQRLQGTLGGG